MLPNIGITELLIILGIAILIFGAKRLPEIGRGLGEGISNFKKALRESSKKDNKNNLEDTSKS